MDEETTSKGSPIAEPGMPPDEACLILIYGGPDLFARYGGEEFAIVLPELEIDQVRLFAESVRRAVEEARFEFAGVEMKVTISVGAAALDTTMTRDHLIKAADTQLYKAKRDGRNRVIVAASPLSKSLSRRTPIPPATP